MMKIISVGLSVLGDLAMQWLDANEQERIELEKRALEGVQVMRGERKLAHEEIDARTAETRRIIDEEKAKSIKP